MTEARRTELGARRGGGQYAFIRFVALLAVGAIVVFGLAACGGESNAGGTQGDPTAPGPGAARTDLQISLATDPNPPKSGPADIQVEVKDAAGKPVEGARVSVSINHVGMSHGGIEGDLVEQGSGRYQASGSFSMSGTWRAEVRVTPQGGGPEARSFDLQVGR